MIISFRVEKIGSCNWYWSFPSEEKLRKDDLLSKSQADRDKASAILEGLRSKVEEVGVAKENEDDEMIMESGE